MLLLFLFSIMLACDPADQVQETVVNSIGRELPPDAVPVEQQVFRYMFREPTTLDISVATYEADGTFFAFERLLLLDENNILVPGAADRWESSPDGKTWTFHLRSGAKWSDGRPVTAQDFEYSFRRMLDPASGNTYAFLYYDIKGGRDFNQGDGTNPEILGVSAPNDSTFIIDTEGPCPYLPYIVSFITSSPVPKWQVEKYGKKWTEPENIVSNFTYKMVEWNHGSDMTFALDRNYNGPHAAFLEKIIVKFIGSQRPGTLTYENGEVDAYRLDPLDYASVARDPNLMDEVHRYQEFTTWYLFFNTREKPYSDLRVRQAIAHAIDRDLLCQRVLNDLAIPAYTMLPPGFPGYAGDELKGIQNYDPEIAKQLLAEAGYPGGKGFPESEFWLRVADTNINKIAGEAIEAMLRETLGIKVKVRYQQRTVYNDNLYQWTIPIGMLAFAYDYPDPSNMLALLWRSQPKKYGRHDWQNSMFDELVDEANTEMNPARRYELYAQAEQVLAEDVGAVFLFHPINIELRKPYLKGLKKSSKGEDVPLISIQTVNFPSVYIGNQQP